MTERELIEYVLENFSDIPTREDAEAKLRNIRRRNEPLLTYVTVVLGVPRLYPPFSLRYQ